MSSISGSHDEVSILGTGLAHFPLIGEPVYTGLVVDRDGVPTVTVRDGSEEHAVDSLTVARAHRTAWTLASAAYRDQVGVGNARHRAVADALRQLADYLDDHPELPVNREQDIVYSASTGRDVRAAVAEVDRVAALLGVTAGRRSTLSTAHTALIKIGPVTYIAYAGNVYPEQVA